jgi:hypothetical protein
VQIAEQRAKRRRIQLEQEAARLAKLPPLLSWFDGYSQPTTLEFASKFRVMQGVRYDTIKPKVSGSPNARDRWLLNTQIALLLKEKFLQLSQCKFVDTSFLCAKFSNPYLQIPHGKKYQC